MASALGHRWRSVCGPDQRACLRSETRHVAFTNYAPPGIAEAALQQHLDKIEVYVRLIAPQARAEQLGIPHAL
jgi:hypothetical protein